MRIYLVGFMGAGKSRLGRALAKQLGYSFVDTDAMVEEAVGRSVPAIFAQEGEAAFRRYEHEALMRTEAMDEVVVATGGGTPLFFDAMEWMNAHGLTVFVRVPVQELYRRLQKDDRERPLAVDPEGKVSYAWVRRLLAERLPVYHQARLIVDGVKASAEEIAHLILNFQMLNQRV